MALRLSYDIFVPKYKSGKWYWNENLETFEFVQIGKQAKIPDYSVPSPKLKYGIQFKDYMDQVEEVIFRGKFARPKYSNDSDVITIQDIKDVVCFSAPSESMSKIFIDFFHNETIDIFLNDLIIYFEYFIKVVEFLLIRRDEVQGEFEQIRNMESVKLEKLLSEYLCQYRLVLAREYSKITLGSGDMKKYHHMYGKMNVSMTSRDRHLFESFLCFSTRVVWIALHRKAYNIIDCEINRLFRSGHFNVAEKQLSNCLKFSRREQQVLYGPNDFRCNYRKQRSPLILEIINVKPKNSEVLWIGEHKYRGTNPRLFNLELEYITPESQLSFIDVQHGILGQPKNLYNTMLTIDWQVVRKQGFTIDYDPYHLIRQPFLSIPKFKEFIKTYPASEPLFQIINEKYEHKIAARQRKLWKYRENVIVSAGEVNLANEHIVKKCEIELENADNQELIIDDNKIIETFIKEKQRKLKQKSKINIHL